LLFTHATEARERNTMIRRARVLGLMLTAVLGLAAASASTAAATKFTAASYPVKITAATVETHRFTVGGGTVSCTSAEFSGELSAASEQLTVIPAYRECTAFGFINAKVTGFGAGKCDYTFYAAGQVDLDCSAGNQVQIDSGGCTTTFSAAENQGLSANSYTNATPTAKQVTVDTQITGIHAVVHSGFGCPVAGGTYTNGAYSGSSGAQGNDPLGRIVGIDVS
jgi:hypothetical protein